MTAEEYLNQSLGSSDAAMSADLFLDEQLKEPVGTSIGDTLQKTAADLEMSIADIPLALGEAFSGLTKTVPASFYAAKEGLARPDQYSKEALAAFDTQREYFKKLEQEATTRKAEGRMTTAGEAVRGAGQSLGFTVAGMAPAIAGGALWGAAAGALFPPAEVATIPIGAIAGVIGSMVASAPVSYRMAGGQFLYDAFKSLEENKGSPLTEEEKTKAYNELLPIAQNTALWEAGPEAIGNAVQLGALKYAFGFGKKAATNVAGQAIEKANNTLLKKVGAVAGGQAIELAGETITQTQQGADQAKMEQYVQTGSTAGAPNEYEGLAGAVKAFKEVAPTTLALGAITAGAGGVVKVAGMGGKEVGKVLFTKPKTPEQIAEDQINDASNRVANDLSISPDDTQANNLNQQIKALSQVQEIRKQTLAAIEPTSREAQTLKLDIAEGETMLGELNQNLTKLTGLSEPITEAEKQQLELAKAITAPVAPAEVATKTYAQLENEALDIQNQISTEAGVSALIGVSDDNLTISGLESREKGKGTKALEIITSAADKNQTTITLKAEPKSGDVQRLKKLYSRFGFVDDPNFAEGSNRMIRFPATTPAPVTEQAAPAEVPAPEVAPVKPLTEDEAETIRDVITLRKSQGREPNPEQVKRLAEYDAKKAGVEVQAGDIVSNIVVGHPMFESPQPELNNLVPIKVTTKEQLASPIQRAQQVRDKAQSYIGNYQVEQAKAKTPAQKKAFAKKFTPSELTRQRDILDYIKNDVIPELDRLEKLAPSATPAVSETITEPATPAIQVEQEIEVGDEASVNLAGRNETVTIARIEDINGVPTAYFDYFGYKSRPLAEMQLAKKSDRNVAQAKRKTEEASKVEEEVKELPAKNFSPSPKTSTAIESQETTNLRNKIKEAKGSDRKIVVMQAMAEGVFFPSAIEAAEFGKPFPTIDKTLSSNLPDELKDRIDTSKIKLSVIKSKSPEEAVSKLISNDDERWILGGVYFDSTNNVVVATDGRALVAIPKKITGGDRVVAARNIKKTTYQEEIKKGQLIDGNYPNWKQVVPTYGNAVEKVDIDIDDALKSATILDSLNNTFNNKNEKSVINFKDARFDPVYILSSITTLVESGAKSITAQIKSKEDPLLLTGDNGSIAVIMPTKPNVAILHSLKAKSGKPKLGEKGGVLIPTKEDFIQAGQNIYEAGMEFGAWAKQMIQRFGDAVREFLGEVWQAVSGAPAKLNEVMGYLPKKGEGGELSFGKTGKLKRYTDKGTIVKLAIKQEKDTPKGILSETIKIIKQRVFDGDSTPSESATKKAWGLIERLKATNPDAKNNAEAINQLTRETMQEVDVAEDATEAERNAFEVIKQTVGMSKLRNELYKYAIKLAGQGDNSMLNYLLNNSLNIAGTSIATEEDIARALGALAGLKSYIIQANEAEQAGFIQLAAQRFFNTTTPTEDQIAKIKRILTAVNETKVNEEEAILEELTQVGEKIGTELVENINTQIDKASKPEVKDPMVAAITAMLKLGGTFVYRKTKNKIKAAVEKTIKGGLTGYRDKLVEGAANGLETGFWKTLSSQENKPGPLGELDSAQNRELGNIVKSTLVSMKLQGKPPNTKMSIYEQVASILGEKPLSQDKIKLADEKIRGEINSKRQNELEQTEDQDVKDAINLKYDRIEFAWDEAMSRNLDMAVSDTMLRRLIFNELKEGETSIAKLAALMDEEPTIGTVRQDRIVSSIINKIAGVTFEGQNPADYTTLKEYLSNQLESLILQKQTENKVVKTKERVKANQAQTELDKLARIQSDTPNFPTSEKVANPVRDAVRNALKLVLNPMFDPKAAADIMRNWKKEFTAELQQLGVDEATALTLTDVVGRQIELDSVSKNLDSIDNAINKGALSGVINAIKNTPLADQQKPDWRYEVMRDYLRNAGLPMAQAEKIAKLMDISLQKRFAKAQEEAAASIAKTILKGIKPESNRGFTALIQAIRAQVLNPGSNVAKEFGRAMGWKGFTAEQLKALNEFDSKINDETITEAERAVALEGIKKIIDKVSLPTKVRNAISAFYIGNALGRFPVATVQVIDPIIFSMWDAAVASARNVTSPSQVMQIWGNFGSSLINAANEFAFSFKNDVTRSGRLVDYLETQDRKLKRLLNDANNLWKSGKYIQATKKYLFGSAEITSRVLKALDDAAFSLLQQNALNQYMISAMNMAKIPKKDQLGSLRMVAQARQMDIADMMATGIKENDAIIYANERMKATISNALSGLNLNSTEIIDAAVNDSLARIGKNRFKEQFNGETEIKDEGTLSYPFLKTYELTSQAIAGIKGKRGEAMRIFQRMIFGFPLIVARVANVAYGYTPLSIYRHVMQKKFGNYPLTYGTAIQRRKRLVEQLAGTAVILPLLFLRSMSFDDEEEKPVSIVFTGFGPVKSKDPEAYNQWHKKHNPGSLEIFIGDKRYAIDSKSAGPLKPMIEILGAIDDWQIKTFQENAKLTKEEKKKVEENAGLLGTLGGIAGSFALTAARRGPATGLMQGLIDFRRYPDDPLAAIAQEASFSLTPFLPIVGFGATKNVSDFLSEPIDTRTKEGAILNNLPIIGPMFGKPAINAFGQPIGDVEISEKIKKSIGIPITLVPVSSGDDAKLAKITLKNANGPEPLQRNWFDAKFETPLSDQEWRTVNEDYARSNRKTVLENYEELNGFDPEIYKTAISNVGTASKYLALDNLYKARKKP